MKVLSVQQAANEKADTAGAMHIGSNETSGRFEIREKRRALAYGLEIVDLQIDVGLAGNSQQMQNGIGGAAGGGHGSDGVIEGVTRENLPRTNFLLQYIQNHLSAVESDLIFLRIHRGNAVEAHRRKPYHLHYGGHGVGGVLAAAGARAGTSDILEIKQFLIGNFSRGVGANRFEH